MTKYREVIPPDAWQGAFGSYEEYIRFRDQPGFEGIVGIDNFGERCTTPADYERARDRNAFPVRYYYSPKR